MKIRFLSLALFVLGAPLGLRGQTAPAQLSQKVFPVADLVTPIPEYDSPTLNAAVGATCRAKSARRLDDELVRLVRSTVARESWLGNGGIGTVEYFPNGQAIVVGNTPENLEQVAQLLQTLRRQQDSQVVVEMYLISAGTETIEKLTAALFCDDARRPDCVAQWFQHRCVNLTEDEARSLMTGVQADPNATVCLTPKCTMLNGQRAVVKIESERTNVAWRVQPRVSADGKFTALSMTLRVNDDTHETVLCVPSGGYCLVGGLQVVNRYEFGPPVVSKIPYLNRLFKNVGVSVQPVVALVKVTPLDAGAEVASKPAPAEEAATAPPVKDEQAELVKSYFDACARGDLPLIKKTHREIQKRAVEKELALYRSEFLERAVPQTNAEKTAPVREDRRDLDSELFSFFLGFFTSETEHDRWTERWLPTPDSVKVLITEIEEEVGWAKPAPKKLQRIGVDFK